ncbi:hypothetical protein SAMN05660691_01606 [Rheinheimera pacifica]|uniref:FTP domain-containing protein n=1 Tax=Rheinheimera pacifica TaxID=173990 RepID=A0A1H6L740_9GAMM|nr:hypothetical protein [Rheinheimera pacifica]SEH81045.1 hypothetical protein SAMN05660691_01606 [Rheinheimera pacifica]
MRLVSSFQRWSFFVFTLFCCTAMASQREFPVPEFFNLHIVADQMQFNGVAMSVSGFTTAKSAKDIETFYRQQWQDEIRVVEVEGLHVISHLHKGLLYTVQYSINQQPSSIIEGFISLSNLPTVSKVNKITLGSGFAMPGGTEVLNDMTSDDGGRKTRMLWLHNKLSVSANVAFYQRRLESDGWISTFVQDANRQAGGLIVKKGNTEMNITVTRVNGVTQLLVIQTGV